MQDSPLVQMMIEDLAIIADEESANNLLIDQRGVTTISACQRPSFGLRLLCVGSTPTTNGKSCSDGRIFWPNSCEEASQSARAKMYLLQGFQDLGSRYIAQGGRCKEKEGEEEEAQRWEQSSPQQSQPSPAEPDSQPPQPNRPNHANNTRFRRLRGRSALRCCLSGWIGRWMR